MIANFDRYLKNTTIFEYKSNNINGQIFCKNPNYNPIKIDGINYFSHQSFFQFIENTLNKLKININDSFSKEIKKEFNINFENDFSEKIRSLFSYIIEIYAERKEENAIRSIFFNLYNFSEKTVFGKEYNENGKEILLPKYTYTDAENFYHTIGSDTIRKIFNGNINIEKIRETRNKFIEHMNDNDREVNFIGGGDNIVGKTNMEIYIKSEDKKYQFSLCPLLDFCSFINEILKKHPL